MRPYKVLLVCDRSNWAYDSIARALIEHNTDPTLEFTPFYLKGRVKALKRVRKAYDGFFVLGWQLLAELKDGRLKPQLPFLDPKRTITGIHSHHAWDNRQTLPDHSIPPPEVLIGFLARYRGVNAVSRRLFDLFKDAGLDNLAYTPNGVDTTAFQPLNAISRSGPLRAGYSGSKKHDWRKGVTEYIQPACALRGLELKLAMPIDGHNVPLEEMPGFYNDIDVYLCASASEGFSLSVLEASACGRPVISTRVGGCEELIEDGVNGFFVDRDVEAIRETLSYLLSNRDRACEMGQVNRRIVEERWSWEMRAPEWIEFIKTQLLS